MQRKVGGITGTADHSNTIQSTAQHISACAKADPRHPSAKYSSNQDMPDIMV